MSKRNLLGLYEYPAKKKSRPGAKRSTPKSREVGRQAAHGKRPSPGATAYVKKQRRQYFEDGSSRPRRYEDEGQTGRRRTPAESREYSKQRILNARTKGTRMPVATKAKIESHPSYLEDLMNYRREEPKRKRKFPRAEYPRRSPQPKMPRGVRL